MQNKQRAQNCSGEGASLAGTWHTSGSPGSPRSPKLVVGTRRLSFATSSEDPCMIFHVEFSISKACEQLRLTESGEERLIWRTSHVPLDSFGAWNRLLVIEASSRLPDLLYADDRRFHCNCRMLSIICDTICSGTAFQGLSCPSQPVLGSLCGIRPGLI